VAVLGGVTRLGDTEIGALLTAISGPRGPGMGRRIAATGSDGSPLGRASCGITVRKMLTDNGSCYRSHAFADTLGDIEHRHTRPYRPQTNQK
jgi:hypothetical protein